MGYAATSQLFFGHVIKDAPWRVEAFEFDFDTWLKKTRNLDWAGARAFLEKYGVACSSAGDLVHRNSYECLFIEASMKQTFAGSVGGPAIDVRSLDVAEGWRESLLAFCSEVGLKIEKQPRWWLTATYS